jgi:hypothetical protein
VANRKSTDRVKAAVESYREKMAANSAVEPISPHRDFYNPNAKAGEVRDIDPSTYKPQPTSKPGIYRPTAPPRAQTEAQKVEAILAEAKALRQQAAAPTPSSPSQAVRGPSGNPRRGGTPVLSTDSAAGAFIRSPAPEVGVRPNREGSRFTPGSRADRAYTGVLPPAERFNRQSAPSGPSPRPNQQGATFTPGSNADMAFTGVRPKANPKPPKVPKKFGSSPWGIVAGAMVHGTQGAMADNQRKQKGKKK